MQSSTRALHLKSRNGCLKCKARKIKCDERKPTCSRCEDRGYQCPGYALNVRWSQKHQMRADMLAAQDQTQSSARQRNTQRTQRNVGEAASPALDLASDNIQEVDSWLNSPSRWDFMMPPELLSLDNTAHALLLNETPACAVDAPWGSPYMDSTAWTVAGDNSNPTFGVDEPSRVSECPPDAEAPEPIVSSQPVEEQSPFGDMSNPQAEPDSRALVEAHQPFLDPPRELFNLPNALSEYFFREVITLYCSWDSKSNVMRNIVENMWQSSGALHHTIQSMAAACLSEDFPHLLAVARQEHVQALQLIQNKVPSAQKQAMLLSSMLLGHTSSWLSPHNLATEMFRASNSILDDITAETGDCAGLSFFNDTMDYWAMLLVYLTDRQQLGDYHRDSSVGPTDPTKWIEPHPYSGISHDMIRTLTDTGSLIFQYRKHMAKVKFMTEKDLDVFRAALREARRLERILLAHRAPDLSQVKDPGDPKTPLKHLELMDEAYRCTGLLQLYRVFPDLLNERYAPWNKDDILRPLPAQRTPTMLERQTWLTKFAMHILGILRDISFESRTRSVQPFIMVAVSSELRRDPQHLHLPSSSSAEMDLFSIDHASIEVARARKFVGSRLAAYTHILPLRKSRVIFELINHVWSALDAGEEDVYWLDIAYEKNLGTMMG
ncbi:hypothetical protein ACJ41O_006046 [Fusarium nematophilum]